MINIRSLIIVISFFVMSIVLISFSSNISTKLQAVQGRKYQNKSSITKFENMSYYLVEKGNEQLKFDAKSLNIIDDKLFKFIAPIGIYNSNNRGFSFQASLGDYELSSGTLNLEENVIVDNTVSNYRSDKMLINTPSSYIQASGNIESVSVDQITRDKILIDAQKMSSWLNEKRAIFEGDVSGKIKRKRAFERGINFTSDSLEFLGKDSQLNLLGNVKLKRNTYDLRANKAEIFLENFNKRLKYYALYDDIELTERFKDPQGVFQTRKAYSEKLEGFISSSKIVLSGSPRVEQKNDIIKGNQITLREKVQLIEVDDSKSFFRINDKENR